MIFFTPYDQSEREDKGSERHLEDVEHFVAAGHKSSRSESNGHEKIGIFPECTSDYFPQHRFPRRGEILEG